ncbi:hypothetical protein [Microbacterium sp. NPDC096154]|uniref:hypothetical protein n=1 Tax=Microbacterium sp. NPDC096154 TaxID=3155549 RepID=UPI003331C23E
MSDIYWPYTRDQNQIMRVTDDSDEVVSIAWDMIYVGIAMTNSARILENVSDSSDGQQGKAVDELRSIVGDTHVLLGKAGEMYTATATAIRDYGQAMRDIAPQINAAYEDADEKWRAYSSQPGDKDGRSYFLGLGKPEEGSAEEEEHKAQDEAKKQAYDDYVDAADVFDDRYDDWEDAWNKAVSAIEDAFDDDVKDSRWEKFKEFLGDLVEVLKWVGLVVGVLALIVGGPILAALAAVVAVTSLLATGILWLAGDKSFSDVMWALVDVIPFGKLGRLLEFGHAGKVLDGHMFSPSTYTKPFKAGEELIGNKSFKDAGLKLLTGKNGSDWKKVWVGEGSHFDMAAFRSRTSYFGGEKSWADNLLEYPIRAGGAALESLVTPVENVFKLNGYYAQVTGDEAWKDKAPVLKIFF